MFIRMPARLLTAVVLVTASLPLSAAESASDRSEQQSADIAISVSDPRPLARAVESLELRFGRAITYEDPPHLSPYDITDVTDFVSRVKEPRNKVLIPAYRTFVFNYRLRTASEAPSFEEQRLMLRAMVEEFNATGNAGTFSVQSTGEVFHLVPVTMRDAASARRSYRSMLDTRISLPSARYKGIQLLRAMVTGLKEAGERRLELGTVNAIAQVEIEGGANVEPARSVLMRLLGAANQRLSWALLCEPGDGAPCALNIHQVKPRTPSLAPPPPFTASRAARLRSPRP